MALQCENHPRQQCWDGLCRLGTGTRCTLACDLPEAGFVFPPAI